MNLAVTIAAVDKTSFIDWHSFAIEDVINDQADTCTFTIKKYGSKNYKPNIRDEVIVTDSGTRIFGGLILNIKERSEAGLLFYDITAKDYTADLDRIIINEAYASQTVNQIITDIKNTWLAGTGITMTHVSCPISVTSITFNSIPVSKAIQTLAEQTNYSWYIDYNKDIHFFSKNTEPAPFNLDDTSGNFLADSLEIDQNISQLRNVVIVRGGEMQGTTLRNKNYTGDGTQKIYGTDVKYAIKPTVTVGGVSKTVGVDNLDADTSFDCMWNFDQKYIRFVTAPAAAAAIVITGYALIPIYVQVEDSSSISRYGRYEFKKIDKNIQTIAEAQQYAQAQLDAYGSSVREGTFTTYVSGLRSGQTISANITARGLVDSFLIQRVQLSMRGINIGVWQVEVATLRTMGIISFLQSLLLGDSRKIDLSQNEILEKYYVDNQTAQVTEQITLKTSSQDYQTAQITEDVQKDPFGANVKPDFVVGPYVPSGQTDPKREIIMDQSYITG